MGPTPHRLADLYRPSLSLLTDLYQVTMAAGYIAAGRADDRAVFHLSFRKNPFKGGYTIAAGLADAAEWLASVRFDEHDRAYLTGLKGAKGTPLLPRAFIDALSAFRFTLNIDAIPEGTAVFPHEPLIRVEGPLWECQLAETALLTIVNFQSLITTKASRIVHAAAGDDVVEFGLRRAQGIDGGLAASRAAYIGGCAATSNVLAGRLLGIPVRGTHAHSWVMSFDGEQEAFDRYADALPNNVLLLVDTYDTLEGVRRAVNVGKRLAASGHRLLGVRLDSGDLAYLSIEARKILDEAGLHDASIVASNDLNETLIESLKHQGAKINVWGVGTQLVTAFDQPALGGVYKLGAVRRAGSERWERRIKSSEQAEKASVPGMLQVRRFVDGDGRMAGDAIYDELSGSPGGAVTIVDPRDATRRKVIPAGTPHADLLAPVMRGGVLIPDGPAADSLETIRARVRAQLGSLHPGILRLMNPHAYPAGLEDSLHRTRTEMLLASKRL